jgi:hypothetical protein
MSPVLKAIDQYYSDTFPAPAYQAYVKMEEKDDRFYDDNQWIAIACIDAYNRTHQQQYLDIAKKIYRFMMTGYDAVSGGGLLAVKKNLLQSLILFLLNQHSARGQLRKNNT